jgi:hypothetical protein
MAAIKPLVRRDSKQMPATPGRVDSHVRVRSPLNRQEDVLDGGSGPSTLPPAPFHHETAVPELEWWLDSHMTLVSRLASLEMLLGAWSEGQAHVETMRKLAADAEAVRDALYELYCDAADDRLESALGPRDAFGEHVRGAYAWCGRVVALLVAIARGLRTPAGPEWTAVKLSFREASEVYPAPSAELRVAIAELAIDTGSPVEPLRHLSKHVDSLFSVTDTLHLALAKRFG